jgi:hypothetical protein
VIVRQEADTILLVRQADHAALSGRLAALWGAGPWQPPAPFPSAVLAARLHDMAWPPWDEAPGQRPDGLPQSFFEVDRVTATALYRRGADAVEALDPYAGLLVSLHYSGFYHGHWEWVPYSSPEVYLEPQAGALRVWVREELARHERLKRALGVDADGEVRLAANYRWLQLWDRISLDCCRLDPASAWDEEYAPVTLTAAPESAWTRLRVSMPEPGRCVLSPYPLRRDPFDASIPVVRLPRGACADRETFLAAWREAEEARIEVRFSSA